MTDALRHAILILAQPLGAKETKMTKGQLIAALAAGTLMLAACGGDDSGDAEAPTTHTIDSVTACFEETDQKVREIETSLAKIPPDVDVSSQAGSADVWVAADEAGADAIVAQAEELAQLGDQSLAQPEVVVSGNAVASISTASSPDYTATIEECLPPSG